MEGEHNEPVVTPTEPTTATEVTMQDLLDAIHQLGEVIASQAASVEPTPDPDPDPDPEPTPEPQEQDLDEIARVLAL